MIQAFVPDAQEGDRRVIVVGGEPVGVVRRVATGGDFRCNMAAGADVAADRVTNLDRAICARPRPDLLDDGLYVVGLDVIGDRLTEINVTSPTGLREIDLLSGTTLGAEILGWAIEHLGR
jgi:glutathione synthase